jgi:hypothetical protein
VRWKYRSQKPAKTAALLSRSLLSIAIQKWLMAMTVLAKHVGAFKQKNAG